MVIGTLAIGGRFTVNPIHARAGKTIAEGICKNIWDIENNKIDKFYEVIKIKSLKDDHANQTFKYHEEKPEDEGRQSAMGSVLKEALAENPQLQKMLGQLLAEAKRTGGDTIIQVYGSGVHQLMGMWQQVKEVMLLAGTSLLVDPHQRMNHNISKIEVAYDGK